MGAIGYLAGLIAQIIYMVVMLISLPFILIAKYLAEARINLLNVG